MISRALFLFIAVVMSSSLAHGQDAFSLTLQEVQKLHSQNKFDEALKRLDAADAMKPNHPAVLQARGNVYMGLHLYDKAREWFLKAAEAQPGSFGTQFALAELDYVQGNYVAAGTGFANLLKAQTRLNADDTKFIQFKVLMCDLKSNQVAQANAHFEKCAFSKNDPAYYFSMMAFATQKGDLAEAKSWRDKAKTDLKQMPLDRYVDAMVEAKWLSVAPPPAKP